MTFQDLYAPCTNQTDPQTATQYQRRQQSMSCLQKLMGISTSAIGTATGCSTGAGWPQTWKPGILMDFPENGKLREFCASLENSGNFFLLLCGHPVEDQSPKFWDPLVFTLLKMHTFQRKSAKFSRSYSFISVT